MTFQMMEVWPELAAQWLGTSIGNPRWAKKLVDKRKVDAIARDILAGDWHPGNSTIAFDEEGRLVDGHHRLSGIVAAGKPVMLCVCRGVTAEGQKHIDDNSARNAGQILRVDRNLTAIANLHFKMLHGSNAMPSVEDIDKFLKHYKGELDASFPVSRAGSKAGCAANRSYMSHAVFCAVACGEDKERIHQFVLSVNNGFVDSPHESAAIALRNQLLLRPARDTGTKIQASKNTQAAIKDYLNGVPRKNPYREKAAYYMDRLPR